MKLVNPGNEMKNQQQAISKKAMSVKKIQRPFQRCQHSSWYSSLQRHLKYLTHNVLLGLFDSHQKRRRRRRRMRH